jgi:transcriptional antiterminator
MINHNIPSLFIENLGRKISVEQFSNELHISLEDGKRQFSLLEEWSQREHIQLLKDNELDIATVSKHWVSIYQNTYENNVMYTDIQRQKGIFMCVFADDVDTSVYLFQELFNVSKNTILSDIKELRNSLIPLRIELKYSRKEGYYLCGAERIIRNAAYKMVDELLFEELGELLL